MSMSQERQKQDRLENPVPRVKTIFEEVRERRERKARVEQETKEYERRDKEARRLCDGIVRQLVRQLLDEELHGQEGWLVKNPINGDPDRRIFAELHRPQYEQPCKIGIREDEPLAGGTVPKWLFMTHMGVQLIEVDLPQKFGEDGMQKDDFVARVRNVFVLWLETRKDLC